MTEQEFFHSKHYNRFTKLSGKIKNECEDFIVKEIYGNEICEDMAKINYNGIEIVDKFLKFLEENENLTLLEINKYEFNYEIIFDKCKYVFNANENEEGNKTVHLNETIIKYLNNLEYKEYFFTCNDKEVRTLMHTLLKLHPMIYTFSDGCYFKIKTCLIQNYSFILKKLTRIHQMLKIYWNVI